MLEQSRNVLKKEKWGVDFGKVANKTYHSIIIVASAQRGSVMCPRSQSSCTGKPGLDPRPL